MTKMDPTSVDQQITYLKKGLAECIRDEELAGATDARTLAPG